jgi:hypothetical protein
VASRTPAVPRVSTLPNAFGPQARDHLTATSATYGPWRCSTGVIGSLRSHRGRLRIDHWRTAGVAILLAALLTLVLSAALAGAAVRRTPTQAPSNTVIDGPDADIVGLSGMVVARDGTGGLVYLKDVSGVPHVFVSTLLGGAFQAPREVDAGLAGPSSHPVIAGSNAGQLVVAFINGGELYAVQQSNALVGWQSPQALYGGASNPALSMTNFNKAYLAFTASEAGGNNVRTLYLNAGQWSPASAPLNGSTGDGAGVGTSRPKVVASGDGTASVVWGEGGHIYLRRVLGSSPSIATYQADPASFLGSTEVSADEPVLAAGGDSSYVSVAFREKIQSGGTRQTRVVFNRLVAGRFTGAQAVDGLGGAGASSADQPATATTEFGAGFVTAEQTTAHNLYALRLGGNSSPSAVAQVNSLPELTAPDAVSSPAGTVSTMIAWQQDPGSAGVPEIRLRYAPDGVNLNPDQVLSSPTLGPTNADLGLAAGGDQAGDAAVAWVQDSGAQTQIVTAQLYQAPGNFTPLSLSGSSRSVNPVLRWSAAAEQWGSPTYQVKLDGVLVAQSTATAVAVPTPVRQGRHIWQVAAVNRAGVATVARSATVLVDSLPPIVSVRITGQRHPMSPMRAYVRAHDTRPGLGSGQVSGVSTVQVRWGDGYRPFVRYVSGHVYRRRGTYRLTVVVKDRAGNQTVIHKTIRVAPVAKKKKKAKASPRRHSHHGARR